MQTEGYGRKNKSYVNGFAQQGLFSWVPGISTDGEGSLPISVGDVAHLKLQITSRRRIRRTAGRQLARVSKGFKLFLGKIFLFAKINLESLKTRLP